MSQEAVGEQTSLSDRKKRAGQRLIMGLSGPALTSDERALISRIRPAGFILFARNVEEPAQVRELNRELASLLPDSIPPIRSVDQEGGRVLRIRDTPWPPMQWLGNIDDHALTARVARGLAEELRAMHFDLTWAPCTDVDSNPDNPVIGDRSFSRSPQQCARHALAWLEGMHQAGLAGCVKHFPGHGDTAQDSHLELPSVEKELPDLQHCELVPFQAAIRAGVEAVMTAHVVFPVLDEEWPATLSRRVLHGMLRTELGHSGLVVSDDLEMKAVHGRFSLDVLLDASCRATCDLFLACEDPQLQWQAWEELIHLQESHPTHDNLARDSNRRLLAFRERFFLGRAPEPPLSVVGSHDNLALSQTVRQRGLL